MEDHSGVTHLDEVSELLPCTQQVIDIVSDMEFQRGQTHFDDVSELLPNTQHVSDMEFQRGGLSEPLSNN